MSLKIVVFDLETQKSFEEVGGARNLRELGMSVGCAYDLETETFHSFREAEVDDLVTLLFSADQVVGFNVIAFDYKVLQPYSWRILDQIPTIDMLKDVEEALSFRVSLNSLAEATLSDERGKVGKSAHGLQAIKWYQEATAPSADPAEREAAMQKIIDYCENDVKLTHQLYDYGRTHGRVYFTDRTGGRREIQVTWKVRTGKGAWLRSS